MQPEETPSLSETTPLVPSTEPTVEEAPPPETVSQADHDAVIDKLAQSEASKVDLQQKMEAVQSRLETAQDAFVERAGRESSAEPVPPSSPALDAVAFTDEGKGLKDYFDGQLTQLRQEFGQKEQGLRQDVGQEMRQVAELETLKRENPEIWDFVGPYAKNIAAASPNLSPRQAWDRAIEEVKPYLEAHATVEQQQKDLAKRVATEKPGGPQAEKVLTPDERSHAEWERLGITEKYRGE